MPTPSGPSPDALYREAIARAFAEQIGVSFAVLTAGLAALGVLPSQTEGEAFARYCVGVGAARRAYALALSFAEAKP